MIKLEGVYKNYGAIRVLEGVNLQVEARKPLCLLGRSGCGKSTILKLIALISKVDKGTLLFEGDDVSKMTEAEMDDVRRKMVAYSFQEPLLIPYITALENVTEVTGAPKEKAVEVLTQLGLGERLNHRPPKLSGGEKKRVDVARAILRGSPILVADEPLSNLDPETGMKVMDMLKEHADEGGTLVYSSVEPTEARFASEVLNMEKERSQRK
jgi:ABC-type lipoprotein export system ATPase subunit